MDYPPGPIILDLKGPEVTQEEKELLQHPLLGGVIFFSRNYSDIRQLIDLCKNIRSSRKTPLLITVDHEGGRVQRFHEGFTRLPSMGQVGEIYDNEPDTALKLAETCGWIMATELLSVGIDMSFAPVLDLNKNICPAIGDRAFHAEAEVAAKLAIAITFGMKSAGMASTGKHFPGHGSVNLDSHITMPSDHRSYQEIVSTDMKVFHELIQNGIQALMPAHIIFPNVDTNPVGFSSVWLQDILQKKLGFSGMIISDDLNMEGANVIGDYTERARRALDAGCDMILICNNRKAAIHMLDHLSHHSILSHHKFKSLQGKFHYDYTHLRNSKIWLEKSEYVTRRVNHEYTK